MRITKEDLRIRVKYLNTILGTTEEGERYCIGYAYGQPRLEKEDGTGCRDISPRGTAGEVYNYLNAFIKGVETAQRGDK